MTADPAKAAFVVIPLALVAMLVWATFVASRRSGSTHPAASRIAAITFIAAMIWLALAWAVAEAGVLRDWERTPPPFALLVVAIFALAGAMAFSGFGLRLAQFIPLWALVAVQGFRLPLELAMHAMYERGVMPRQMSYSGLNFDIVSGATAIVVAALVWSGRANKRVVMAWNIVGVLLLLNVVAVAILATPRFRYFGEDALNTWVMDPPFVWLPAVMVLAALAGHLVIFRAVRFQPG